MASIRTTITLDETLAERARTLGINVSAAARDGVAAAVAAAAAQVDVRVPALRAQQLDDEERVALGLFD